MTDVRYVAIGCMRLSTERDRHDAASIGVLHAAFDAGITLLDTADAYCWDDRERGHNERLIAHALSTWRGDRSRVTVATKGGLTRPDGRWEPDGRAKHLMAACEQSCRALGVDRIDLYQLHAPDSRTPLATSVRALAALKRDGRINAIGLCNVTVGQIEEARRITEIDSIQVEISVWHDTAFLNGVVDYCLVNGLSVLAYRPLGGRRSRARTKSDPALNAVAERHDATPFEVALAWLTDLSKAIVPLPGLTRVETAQSVARAARLELTDNDRAILDQAFSTAAYLRVGILDRTPRRGDRQSHHGIAPQAARDADIVLLMGLPGAGKTTYAQRFIADGYARLNRDEAGGTLRDLIADLDRALAAGGSRIVLDNTYLSRKSRAEVIRAAAERGAAVRCVWLSMTIEDAQVNAVERIVSRCGELPDEKALARLRKTDIAAFLPSAQFRSQRELEPPDPSEGFSVVETLTFERQVDPARGNRAVIVWCDDVLIRSRSGQRVPADPDDVEPIGSRAEVLRRYRDEGWKVFGLSWQPEIADGTRSRAEVEAVFARMNELLSHTVEVHYCPHAAGPPRCWCRKPLPGLGVLLIHRHQLDPAQCIYVGEGSQDPGFARKLGFAYQDASQFFTPTDG